MKIEKEIVHAIFTCEDCGKHWEDYLTAQNNARRHAKKHGHKVAGDVAYGVSYDGRKTNEKAE